MTEYWKSIDKKYCDFCKCWITDNKSSREFHERGFRHKANVRKRLNEIRQKGAEQAQEQKSYNLELMKIEAAAMKSFQSDISSNPSRATELSTTKSLISKLPIISTASSSTGIYGVSGRFGDSNIEEESLTLVRGREKALDTITKALERKSKWLEAKTAEGIPYYFNRETNETKWEAPKCGYLTLDDQKSMNITEAPGDSSSTVPASSSSSNKFKVSQYGKWQTVNTKPYKDNMVDLQLPKSVNIDYTATTTNNKEEKFEFKEKVVTNLSNQTSNSLEPSFKKMKTNASSRRKFRRRDDDED